MNSTVSQASDLTKKVVPNQALFLEPEPDQVATDINLANDELETGEIRGSKWNDLNGDSIWDEGEPGLAGWTIYLDQNQNGQLDEGEISTLTDANGNYAFTGLTPEVTYTVAEVLQPTWEQTYPISAEEYFWSDSDQLGGLVFNWVDISTVGTPVYLSDDSYIEVSLPFSFSFYGQENNTVKISSNGYLSFGDNASSYVNEPIPSSNTPNAYIAPFWDDLNPNEGGSIYYYNDTANNRFIVQYQDISHYGSGGINNYTFEVILNLDGTILYQYDNLNGFVDSATVGIENFDGTKGLQIAYNQNYVHDDLAISIKPLLGGLRPYIVNLDPGQVVSDINFGNWNPVTISGNKWQDLDGDGTRDEGESGLAGWTIYLDTNNNGQLDSGETSTLTDADGNYSFTLTEGTYTVAEVLQTGWVQTSPSESSYTVSLAGGEKAENLNFGNQPLPGEISGYKWNDLNGDSIWDEGEPGLAGWTIYLDQNQNGQLDEGEISTLTDANGNYAFTGLTPEFTYTVAEVLQPTWVQTFPGGSRTTIIDFEVLRHNDSAIEDHGFHYEEDGFALDNLSTPFPFSTAGTQEDRFSGSTALYNNTPDGITRLTSLNGKPFDLVSIDLTELNGPQVASVAFTGTLSAGGTVTQTFSLDGIAFNPQTFVFNGFNDVLAVEWVQVDPFHQFDNITIDKNTYSIDLDPGEVVSDINFGNYYSLIEGTSGNDELAGTPTTDIINGFEGNDQLSGKENNDTLTGGVGIDTLWGNGGNDSLSGNRNKDILYGNLGDDTLRGNRGNDDLWGNRGNDSLYGNQGRDELYGNPGDDQLWGNQDNDQLWGGKGNDTLWGGTGNDILRPGEGNDVLRGGLDQDIFVIEANGGSDTIADFNDGQDQLGLSDGLTFAQLTISSNTNNTLIKLTSNNSLLATLTEVDVNLIDANDFVAI